MNYSIRLTTEERTLAENYALRHAIPLDEAFKQALFERIEDEHDIIVVKEAYKEYAENPKTYSHEEVKKILDL